MCDFCRELATGEGPEIGGRPVRSRFLFRSADFAVFPSLGCLTTGHLLLTPVRHVLGFRSLPVSLRRSAERLLTAYDNLLERVFCRPLVFEHGTGWREASRGPCISHAHIHLVPLPEKVIRDVEARCVGELPSLKAATPDREYLYLRTPGDREYFLDPRGLPSQFMRRIIARALGRPSTWDWYSFPRIEMLQATMDLLQARRPSRSR